MKRTIPSLCSLLLGGAVLSGCTVVDTGEVGLRVKFDKTVESEELVAGSFNQTVIGKVLTFPVKDVSVDVRDMQPLASDNSTMKDFDISVIYNIMPASVSDLYINKSRAFHMVDNSGDIYLMHTYIYQTARNAVYKIARKYEALNMNDNRAQIEQELQETMIATLADEKLTGIVISQVRVEAWCLAMRSRRAPTTWCVPRTRKKPRKSRSRSPRRKPSALPRSMPIRARSVTCRRRRR